MPVITHQERQDIISLLSKVAGGSFVAVAIVSLAAGLKFFVIGVISVPVYLWIGISLWPVAEDLCAYIEEKPEARLGVGGGMFAILWIGGMPILLTVAGIAALMRTIVPEANDEDAPSE